MVIYNYLWYFVLFSFLGWCMEVAYHTVCCGDFSNRGFLNGPVCPIYGCGAVMVIASLRPFSDDMAILFLCATVITSLLELVTGYVLEKIFHTKWWDYSETPFNIGGYICLKFSLCWGVVCTFLMRVILPGCDKLIGKIPLKVGIALLAVFGACYLADAVYTVITLRSLKIKIRAMEEISVNLKKLSDELGIHISDSVADIMEKTGEVAKAGKEKAEEFDELKEQYKAKFREFNFGQRRIIRAFPKLSSDRYKNALAGIKKYFILKK